MKNREIDWSYLWLQQFDEFWICSARNDRKRKLCEFSETYMKKFVKSLHVNLVFGGFGAFGTAVYQAARAIVVFLVRVHCTPTESSARARPLSLLSMDQVGLAMPGSSSFLFGTVQSSWYSVQLLCSVASHVEKKTKKQSLNYVNH